MPDAAEALAAAIALFKFVDMFAAVKFTTLTLAAVLLTAALAIAALFEAAA